MYMKRNTFVCALKNTSVDPEIQVWILLRIMKYKCESFCVHVCIMRLFWAHIDEDFDNHWPWRKWIWSTDLSIFDYFQLSPDLMLISIQFSSEIFSVSSQVKINVLKQCCISLSKIVTHMIKANQLTFENGFKNGQTSETGRTGFHSWKWNLTCSPSLFYRKWKQDNENRHQPWTLHTCLLLRIKTVNQCKQGQTRQSTTRSLIGAEQVMSWGSRSHKPVN